jgi:RHS repeat-associated protein
MGGGSTIAQFGYAYNADDLIKSRTLTAPVGQSLTYAYDAANRLTSGLIGTGSPQYVYAYDKASNLTSITPNGPSQSFAYTAVNTIATGSYDTNGSPLSLGGKTYKWDGANRLVHFANPTAGTGSIFTYNGQGRLARVVDTQGLSITADHSYTWCGSVLCLAHDNTRSGSPVSAQYFPQGLISGGTKYYYVRDQVGSVTAMVSSSGAVTSQFTYDPYGNQMVTLGSASDVGYAGYFYHAASGLDFTLHRAYDPAHARWLNRDPAGELEGPNLYAYASGNPIAYTDPTGLWTLQIGVTGSFGIFGPAAGSVSAGIAIDSSGTVAGYVEYGGGAAVGAEASVGVSVHGSNADSVDQLNGPFVNASAGAGLGPYASIDGLVGANSEGGPILGGGFTVGVGVGGGVSTTVTNTDVSNPIGAPAPQACPP